MSIQIPERYEILRPLGEGGMGMVFLARDRELGRKVALKFLRDAPAPGSVLLKRFVQEAEVMARVSHPNVAAIYDALEAPEPVLVMEYIDGESLATYFLRRGPLPPAEVLEIGIELATGLGRLHEVDVLHRDIKPPNILLRGEARTPVLMDLGLARTSDQEDLTQTGAVVGTPRFIPPECVKGRRAQPASDVFQLCAVLFLLLVGEPHVDGESVAQVGDRIARGEFRPIPDDLEGVPPRLRETIRAGLALRPEDRPADGDALAACLRGAQDLPKVAEPSHEASTLVLPRAEVADLDRSAAPGSGARPWPALLGATLGAAFLLGAFFPPGGSHDLPEDVPVAAAPAPTPPPPLPPPPIPPGRRIATLVQHEDLVGALAFSPGGELLASVGGDGGLALWEPRVGALVDWSPPLVLPLTFALDFHPGRGRLALGGLQGALGLRETSPPGPVEWQVHLPEAPGSAPIRGVAWLPDGTLASGDDDGNVVLQGPVEVAAPRRIPVGGPVRALAALGRDLACAVGEEVRVLDTGPAPSSRALRGHVDPIQRLEASRDGARLLSVSRRHALIWNPATGETVHEEETRDGVASLAPDGARLAVPAREGGGVRILEIPGGRVVHELEGHTLRVSALRFGPGGEILASGCRGGEVRLWDLRSLEDPEVGPR